MFGLLSKIFIKNRDDLENPAVRRAYGILSGALGIVLNILLFAGKLTAGLISGSTIFTAHFPRSIREKCKKRITMPAIRCCVSRTR